MPDDHPRTAQVLGREGQGGGAQAVRAYLGATGWSNPEWVGKWYPPRTKSIDYLRHYSKQFGCIEFNTTHYRVPDAELVARWRAEAADGFKFCPKVPQQISHYGKLNVEVATTAFTSAIHGLGDKLGPVFLQLPDHHSPVDAGLVQRFARQWPRELELHWEFRHPDWFNGNAQAEATFDVLEELGQGIVITDVAGRRDVLHMRLTCPKVLLRFVGNALHPTDYPRTQDWTKRLAQWGEMGLKEAYIFVHQWELELVPDFSNYWAACLRTDLGISVRSPQEWQAPPPAQPTLF